MTENGLTKALCDLIQQAAENYRYPIKNGEPRAPRIINGYLPPKRSGQDDDFPFIIVRPDAGEIEEEKISVDVSILICCYTEEFDGYEYCLNTMQRIRAALMGLMGGILDSRYVLQFPLKWSNPAEQPYPYWQVDLTTKWEFSPPQMPF